MNFSERKPVKQSPAEPHAKALRGVFRQTEVFVHMESGDPAPIDIRLAEQRFQHRRLAGCSRKDHPYAMLDSQSTAQFSSHVAGRLAAHISARVANVYRDCTQVFFAPAW